MKISETQNEAHRRANFQEPSFTSINHFHYQLRLVLTSLLPDTSEQHSLHLSHNPRIIFCIDK
jgi:hypothetical protein